MKRHKKTYLRPTEDADIQEIVMIMRRPKCRNRMRNIMWGAWNIKWDHFAAKKYKEYE